MNRRKFIKRLGKAAVALGMAPALVDELPIPEEQKEFSSEDFEHWVQQLLIQKIQRELDMVMLKGSGEPGPTGIISSI